MRAARETREALISDGLKAVVTVLLGGSARPSGSLSREQSDVVDSRRHGGRRLATAKLFSTAFFLYATPILDAKLAPLSAEQSVEFHGDDRLPGRMCGEWHWTMARYAQPIVLSWSISIEGTAVKFPAITERQGDRQVVWNPQARALGRAATTFVSLSPKRSTRRPA